MQVPAGPTLVAMDALQDLIESWDGELVAIHRDRPSGAAMIVCVHSSRLGPAGGGVRLKTYPDLAAALRDGQRLAAAMTLKFAVHSLPMGGGKSVLSVPSIPAGAERRRLLLEFGAFLQSLGGVCSCASDMNTDARDMDVIGEVCSHVFCRSLEAGGSGDTGPDTATGVFHGIEASVRHHFQSELAGRTILVQGLGSVGGPLARHLLAAGAAVLVADPEPDRVQALVALGARAVDPAAALTTECDVLAPCATGAVLSETTIPGLRCGVVAGAANNQLAVAADAARLRERGILYAPDYVINSGGALHGSGLELLGWTREELDARLAGIGDTLSRIYRSAEAEGITTDEAAQRLAAEALVRA